MALVIVALLAIAPAAADQNDARLGDLFEELKSAPSHGAAQGAEAAIWGIWYEHDDDIIEQLMLKSRAAMNRRDFKGALRSIDQVIALAPDFAEGWNLRATLYYLMGSYEASLADIKETLTREPRHFGALSGRGMVYSQLDEPDLALRSFEEALVVNPQMPGPRLNAEAIRKELQDREI